ncbi:unnamed protein product [Colias eurytheme]|nr:unnamed protein product [Colias eurytheme]
MYEHDLWSPAGFKRKSGDLKMSDDPGPSSLSSEVRRRLVPNMANHRESRNKIQEVLTRPFEFYKCVNLAIEERLA